MPVNGGMTKNIYSAISTKLERFIPGIDCRIFSVGKLSASYMYMMIESVISAEVDLIVVYNVHSALIVQKCMKKLGKQIPVLFTGIIAPEQYSFVDSLEKPGQGFTGVVYPAQNMTLFCEFLYKCFPHLKSVAVLTQLTGKHFSHKGVSKDNIVIEVMEDYPGQVKSFFNSRHIRCNVIYDSSAESLLRKAVEDIDKYSVLIIIEGTRVTFWSDLINRFCIRHDTIVYSGWGLAVERGDAALGYGVDYKTIGEKLADKALQILFEGRPASDIPVEVIEGERGASINLSVLNQYDVDMNHIKYVARKWNAKIYE